MLDISRRQFLKITGGFVAGTATVGSFSLIGDLRANAATASMVTWNMQGANDEFGNKWNQYVEQLVKNHDYICLQEAGPLPSGNISNEQPPPWLTVAPPNNRYEWKYVKWNVGTRSRPVNVYILWLRSYSSSNRVNLAVCSKTQPDHLIYIPPGLSTPKARPSIGMHIEPYHVYTLHGLSGSGNDTPALIRKISRIAAPWYALGDYNREPQTWTPPDGVICPPDKPTHEGEKKLDYMVRSGSEAETGEVQPAGATWSDHAFVTYDTSSTLRTSRRTLVNLKCLGDVDGPRFLDGRTGDGTVGLVPTADGLSGTKWKMNFLNNGAVTLERYSSYI